MVDLPAGRQGTRILIMYYFYVLENSKRELYKGITNNIDRRINEHNKNKSIGTRGKGPWILVYFEKHKNRENARAREKYFKTGCGRDELKNIILNYNKGV